MYNELDDFLNEETWNSFHWADRDRSFRALDRIVRDPLFDPQKMGQYIADKHRNQFGGVELDQQKLQYYINAAAAVQDYLKAVKS